MNESKTSGFFGRMMNSVRLTGQFLRARGESRHLTRRRGACQAALDATWQQLGETVIEGGLGTELPGFAPADTARREATRAQQELSDREMSMKAARQQLEEQSAEHQSKIAGAQAEKKSAESAAAHAARALHEGQKTQAAMEADIHKCKSRLAELAVAAASTESVADVTTRVQGLRAELAGLKSQADAARQAVRESAAAMEAQGKAIRQAISAGQAQRADLQKSLAQAEAMTGADRDASIQSARSRLAEQETQQEKIVAPMQAEHDRLAERARADQVAMDELNRRVSETQGTLRRDQDILDARQLQATQAQREEELQKTLQEVNILQTRADEAHQQLQAKSAELQRTQQDWAAAKAKLDSAVDAATKAHDETARQVESASRHLLHANQQLGMEAHRAGIRCGACEAPAVQADGQIAQLADMDRRLAELALQMNTTRNAARWTLAAGTVLVVLLLAVSAGAIWLAGKFKSGNTSGAHQVSAASSKDSGSPTRESLRDSNAAGPGTIPATAPAGPLGEYRDPSLSAQEQQQLCQEHLKTLAGAIKVYRLVHEGKNPAKLSELYYEGLVESVSVFACPASGKNLPGAQAIDELCDYELVGQGENWNVREKTARHAGKILDAGPADRTPPPAGDLSRPVSPPVVTTLPVSAQDKKEALSLYFSAMDAHTQKKPLDAEQLVRKAIEKNPASATYYRLLGLVLSSQSKWNEAIEAFRAAQRLEPETGSYHGMIAETLLKAGRREEAIVEARKMFPFGIREHWIYKELGITPPPEKKTE